MNKVGCIIGLCCYTFAHSYTVCKFAGTCVAKNKRASRLNNRTAFVGKFQRETEYQTWLTHKLVNCVGTTLFKNIILIINLTISVIKLKTIFRKGTIRILENNGLCFTSQQRIIGIFSYSTLHYYLRILSCIRKVLALASYRLLILINELTKVWYA